MICSSSRTAIAVLLAILIQSINHSNAQVAQCTGAGVTSNSKIACMNSRRVMARSGFGKNQEVPVYVTVSFQPRSTDLVGILPAPFTAQFFPRVDSYTNMSVTNSSKIWTAVDSTATYDNLVVNVNVLGFDTAVNAITFFQPGTGKRWCSKNQQDLSDANFYYVFYRSIIITLENGFVREVEWEPTYCISSNKVCIDGMFANKCSVDAGGQFSNSCKISIFVLWAGTDVNGLPLTSSSNSRWNLEKFRIF